MGGRGDRDRLGDRVDAVGAAGGEDRREAVLPHLGAEVPGVEVHVLGALLLHPAHDALGDDVAGRQLGQLVLPDHEAHAVGVDQVGALAAYRLGDQRLLALGVRAEEQHGRVELDELQVGDLRARRAARAPRRRRWRPTGWWSRRRPGPCRRWRGPRRGRGRRPTPSCWPSPMTCRVTPAVRPSASVSRSRTRAFSIGAQPARAYRLDERAGDLGAGRVAARVRDTAAVVAALAGELDLAVPRTVSKWAPVAISRRTASGPSVTRIRTAVLVAQAGARDQGVVQVLLGGVALAEGGGDAALRPAGGAVVEAGLGDDDRSSGPAACAAQGRGQAGDAGADDDDVRVDGPARARGACSRMPGAGHAAAPKVEGEVVDQPGRPDPGGDGEDGLAGEVVRRTSVKSDGSTRAR